MSLEDERARYVHDCEACTFLGTRLKADLYSCGSGDRVSLIARYGDDGPDYKSMDKSTLWFVRSGGQHVDADLFAAYDLHVRLFGES